jgi:hypothetical protein
MIRRKAIPEMLPDTRDFVDLVTNWRSDGITALWGYVWQGWDSYCTNVISKVDLSKADDQLERMITQDLELDIRQVMGGFPPFVIQHERFEEQERSPSPARPKQPDLTFVWFEHTHRRIKYALEAKVLQSDSISDVGAYVEEITENFLKFRYAPFSSEGGMLGYLVKGKPIVAFSNIETKVSCSLSDHPDFAERAHKISDHDRTVPTGKKYPVKFRCHHLILQLTKNTSAKKATAKRKSSKKASGN